MLPVKKKANAETESIINEVIPINKSEMDISLQNIATTATPFDESLGKPMEGYSVTPKVDEKGQITSENGNLFTTSPFELNERTSLFMWIYLPDAPLSSLTTLTLSVYTPFGQSLVWSFSPSEFDKILDNFYDKYGWKLIEFVYEDAEKNFVWNDSEFSRLEITYKMDQNMTNYVSISNTLSIYHAYTAMRTSDKTSILKNTRYYHFSFNPDFNRTINALRTGDSLALTSYGDIFSYIYVGKSSLHISSSQSAGQNIRYEWEITFYYNDSVVDTPEIGKKVYFDKSGRYKIIFVLKEQRGLGSLTEVFSATKAISISNLTFGKFLSTSYDVSKNDKLTLVFEISPEFYEDEDKVSFSSSDEKIATINSVRFDSETSNFYVVVEGIKKGNVQIVAKLSDDSGGSNTSREFSEATTLNVNFIGINSWIFYSLYAVIGVCVLGFVIIMVISFVNTRRNGVK